MPSYISPKVEIRSSEKSGKGLFALNKILANEVLVDYTDGFGKFITTKEANQVYDKGLDHMIQIDDDLFFAATEESETEDADLLNHSCNPNCGIKDKLKIVAIREIQAGEELTIDYAMMESSDYSFNCNCGSSNCRKVVTGDDWKIAELQRRYAGYFSDYLEKRIRVEEMGS